MAPFTSGIVYFTLPMPPSVNCLYDGGRKTKQRFKSDRYKDWIKHARQFITAVKNDHGFVCFDTPVAVLYRFGMMNDAKGRDVANYEKALSDLLVAEGILVDDKLIMKNYQEWADDVAQRMVEVVIAPASKMEVKLDQTPTQGSRFL